MSDEVSQALVVRLPAEVVRRIVSTIDRPASSYRSIDEFARVAIENHLALESVAERPAARAQTDAHLRDDAKLRLDSPRVGISAYALETTSIDQLLKLPPDLSRVETLAWAGPSAQRLSSFTNRLAPVVAGPRVLASLSSNGSPPDLDSFLDATARVARMIGLRFREEDEEAGRRGRDRRSIGWPVGDDETKSLIRYRNCFMIISERGDTFSGPLAQLGLVAVKSGQAYLTDDGLAFARCTSPALDESSGVDVLSSEHRELLINAVLKVPKEVEEIAAFLRAVADSKGQQDEVDREIATRHQRFSEAQVVSHRAAILGRLRDLDVVDVETTPEGKATIIEGANFRDFTKLAPSTGVGNGKGGK